MVDDLRLKVPKYQIERQVNKMYNVDTITLGMSTEKYCTKRNGRWYDTVLDYEHTKHINEKIISRMWLDKDSKEVKETQDNWKFNADTPYPDGNVYYHAIDGSYVFNFNDNWNYLTITLEHDKVETFTEKEIIEECYIELTNFFDLTPDDLNELKLNRLDVKCDYRYEDLEEYAIIKNIIEKAPDKIYTYEKKLLKDDDYGYIVTYSATRKNNITDKLFDIGG